MEYREDEAGCPDTWKKHTHTHHVRSNILVLAEFFFGFFIQYSWK
jgi:hypothetical protein